MPYDKNTNYKKLMDEAAARGDYATAAAYEKQRNAKIQGEGLGYGQTNLYAQYLPGATAQPGQTAPTAAAGLGYENPYAQELEGVIARIQGQGREALKKQYLAEADRTMQDTLGQYSLRTGALPSTAAIAAASQAADYTKSQLGSQLLNLDQAAADLMLSAGSMAQSDYQLQINDALTRWQSLGYADEKVAAVLGVAVGTPTSSQSYQNWQMSSTDRADAYERAMTMLQLGQMPGADLLAAAGLSAQDAQGMLGGLQTSYGGYSGGSSGERGKILDQTAANELAARYREGGWGAISADLAYLQAQGYDVDWLSQWIYNYYSPGMGGYTGGYAAQMPGGGGSAAVGKHSTISTK